MIALACGATLLAACAEEPPEPGPLTREPDDVSTPQPEATGPVSLDDFAGRTFPYPYAGGGIGEVNGGQAFVQRGVGSVVINDDLTEVRVTLEEGDDPPLLTRPEQRLNFFSGQSFDDSDIIAGMSFVPTEVAAEFSWNSRFGSAWGFVGFETPAAARPTEGTAIYGRTRFVLPTLVLAPEGDEFDTGFTPSSDAIAMSIDFATGDVTGVVFRGFGNFDFEGDFSQNDRIDIEASIVNGRWADGEIRGEVTFTATLDIDERGMPVDLPLDVIESDVSGMLFGEFVQAAGVTYSGSAMVMGADGPLDVAFAGASLGSR